MQHSSVLNMTHCISYICIVTRSAIVSKCIELMHVTIISIITCTCTFKNSI